MRGLIDTSVFIAQEQRRSLRSQQLPDESAISTVTLAELAIGGRLARDDDTRLRRSTTLDRVRARYVPLPVDEPVAEAFAELVANARRHGRRVPVQDMWIAATAKAHRVRVYTQDDDFDGHDGVEVVRI